MRWHIEPKVEQVGERFAVLENTRDGDVIEHHAYTCGLTEYESMQIAQDVKADGGAATVLPLKEYLVYAKGMP